MNEDQPINTQPIEMPQAANNNVTPPEQPKSSPWLYIVLIVVVVIAAVYYGWMYLGPKKVETPVVSNTPVAKKTTTPTTAKPATTPTTVSTADWKTYTNTEYGYSIKYPSTWTINSNNQNIVSLNSPENTAPTKESEGYMEDINIYYYANLQAADGNNPKKYTIFSDLLNDKSVFAKTPIKTTLAGQIAYEAIEGGFGTYYTIIAENNTKIYKILFGNVSEKSKLNATQNQILSTFQFVK